jgi:hypothetical protein
MKLNYLSFLDLISLEDTKLRLGKKLKTPKNIFKLGVQKKITIFVVNKTYKYIYLIKWGEDTDSKGMHYRFYEEKKPFITLKGQMIPLSRFNHFDLVFKGVLNELDLYEGLDGYEPIEYMQSQDLFDVHGSEQETPPNKFQQIFEKDLFMTIEDFNKLEEHLEKPQTLKQSKQQERELIFAQWLDGKSIDDVSLMKKDDVWIELQKLNHPLFSVESKNFFRDQKIITFKSGRKPKLDS